MNELEAVNMLLDALGSDPVNSLETQHPDVTAARRVLSRRRKMELRKGWWFNTDWGVVHEPDATTREISVPTTLASILMLNSDIVRRDGKLYDTRNQTSKFDSEQTAYKQIGLPKWDDMEADMQVYCAYIAAVEFIRNETNDMQLQKSLGQDAGLALIELKRTDLRMKNLNAFDGANSRKLRQGVMPYGSGVNGLVRDTLQVNK